MALPIPAFSGEKLDYMDFRRYNLRFDKVSVILWDTMAAMLDAIITGKIASRFLDISIKRITAVSGALKILENTAADPAKMNIEFPTVYMHKDH